MSKKAQVAGSVVAGFPSPAEQYLEPPLDLNELPVKLRAERIHTAKDLRDAPDDVIRSVGGVTLLRTATKLRGIPCNQDRDYNADPESISCSRSFGEHITKMEALMESCVLASLHVRVVAWNRNKLIKYYHKG